MSNMQVKTKFDITLHPDKLTFQGPQVDGGYKVVMYCGEYDKSEIVKLMALPESELEVKIQPQG